MIDTEKLARYYFKEFQKIGKKEKIIILAILACSFLFGLYIPIILNKLKFQNKPYSYLASPSPTPTSTPIPLPATLSLTSDRTSIKTNSTFSATININSPNQGVEAADFVVNFDPKYIKAATISGGNFFGLYPVKKIAAGSIKISGLANLVDNRFIIPKGKGEVAIIVFKATNATQSARISFDAGKTIVASGGKNIIGETKDLIVKIK